MNYIPETVSEAKHHLAICTMRRIGHQDKCPVCTKSKYLIDCENLEEISTPPIDLPSE
jgi:hypothetical protein